MKIQDFLDSRINEVVKCAQRHHQKPSLVTQLNLIEASEVLTDTIRTLNLMEEFDVYKLTISK